ncbi:MAG TPA: DUF6299 family protein [Intrasporangium sp.]|nr:DUF6299 family protein [Intrasporangium sp.]
MKASRRFLAAIAAALTSLTVVGSPALAAPPGNDTFSGAETITAVPFSTSLDTTEATTDADDAELSAAGADVCGVPPAMDASVWFSFTPTDDNTLLADARASDFGAGVFVATGAPGSFTVLGCGPGGAVWDAVANETYYIVVIDDQTDGAGNGGQMELTLDVAPPPPALDVTVNNTARFDSKTGSAILSGTIMCGSDAEFAFLEAQVTQRVGRLLIRGSGGTEVTCDDTVRPWELEVIGDNGLFKGGKAISATFSAACGAVFCSEYSAENQIQLKGRKR